MNNREQIEQSVISASA
ncbi:DUF1024 family protein, partial [Staphylococcus aureus]|nr:DUF1024 family protein [Staphylococcus aureus]MCE3392645.1 DUF1024 family protein [Staphylococcus aureus]MCE5103332.1 DUF1024 family protein [Staphylococcus aureus]MCE5111305.1 DUF1024 family protein [Staphylococcus aureus]MCE5113973.1 DUF1024 family protein [Staphylococcus aureus]